MNANIMQPCYKLLEHVFFVVVDELIDWLVAGCILYFFHFSFSYAYSHTPPSPSFTPSPISEV